MRWGCWYVKWGYLWGCEGFEFFRVLRSRSSGVARQPVTFFQQQKKVTKKCRNLTAKLDHDGCISKCCLSSSSRGIIAKRYRGYFFVLHLHQALHPTFPFSEIVVRLFIILCLALTLSPSIPHYTQQLSWVKNYSFELRCFIFLLFSFFLSGMRSSIVKIGR